MSRERGWKRAIGMLVGGEMVSERDEIDQSGVTLKCTVTVIVKEGNIFQKACDLE